jgi:tRNA isopentenyl-2-thiomethyl-A-37 hydroxylase MiaE
VTILHSATDPRWVAVALADLERILQDHAHCEKKAAASALKLIADHPAGRSSSGRSRSSPRRRCSTSWRS